MLENLLRGYSHLNKELTYCQGMNYVMGFCYINLQDPNITFKCFVRLMEWHVKPIFEREFKVLKQYFFKFNRIIDLYLPDLAEHFKVISYRIKSKPFRQKKLKQAFSCPLGSSQSFLIISNIQKGQNSLRKSGISLF